MDIKKIRIRGHPDNYITNHLANKYEFKYVSTNYENIFMCFSITLDRYEKLL